MDHHLGYYSNSKDSKPTDNRRNGYGSKKVKTSYDEIDIDVPRDRDASFEPELIKKRQTDVSSIENKVLAMYARGMSQKVNWPPNESTLLAVFMYTVLEAFVIVMMIRAFEKKKQHLL